MGDWVRIVGWSVLSALRSRRDLVLENVALRQQLVVLGRQQRADAGAAGRESILRVHVAGHLLLGARAPNRYTPRSAWVGHDTTTMSARPRPDLRATSTRSVSHPCAFPTRMEFSPHTIPCGLRCGLPIPEHENRPARKVQILAGRLSFRMRILNSGGGGSRTGVGRKGLIGRFGYCHNGSGAFQPRGCGVRCGIRQRPTHVRRGPVGVWRRPVSRGRSPGQRCPLVGREGLPSLPTAYRVLRPNRAFRCLSVTTSLSPTPSCRRR